MSKVKKQEVKEEVVESKPELPTQVEIGDAVLIDLYQTKLTNAQLLLEQAQTMVAVAENNWKELQNRLSSKYILGPKDSVNLQTREIKRVKNEG